MSRYRVLVMFYEYVDLVIYVLAILSYQDIHLSLRVDGI